MKSHKLAVDFPTLNSLMLSTALYILLLGFILYKAADAMQKVQKFTDTKDSFIDVMIVTENRADIISAPKANIKDKQTQKATPKSKQNKEEIVTTNKASTQEIPQKEQNVQQTDSLKMANLFDNIKTQVPKKQEVTSRKKSAAENNVAQQKAKAAIDALQDSDEVRALKQSASGTFDEFKGAIYRIVSQYWQRYLASTNDKIRVSMIIDTNGRLLSYNFITNSYDSEFQGKARDLMENLKSVTFPLPPSNTNQKIEILLSDEVQMNME